MNKITKIFFLSLLLYTLQTLFALAQLVPDFRVNDDTTNRSQYNGRIGFDSLGQFTIVWEDYRNNKGNIYCQRFNSNGTFSGINFRINVNPDSSSLPGISVTRNGNFGVCWLEINSHISNSSKMKCRLYKYNSSPITGEILLNDSTGNFHTLPSIEVNRSNEYIIAWNQKGILYQRIDSVGNKIGNNILVNDNTVFAGQGDPAVNVRKDGNFIITWSDTRPPSSGNSDDIYFQMFDSMGNPIGLNQKVNDDISTANQQRYPKISSDTTNKFIIAWHDNRESFNSTQFYGQNYLSTGVKDGINFRLYSSSNKIGALQLVKKEDGKYLVGWDEDIGSTSTLYFQRYDSSNIKIGLKKIVSTQSLSTSKIYSNVGIFDDNIFSVWNDERNGPFDVYCNIRSFSNPDTTVYIIQISSLVPENFTIFQNYPNPFNSFTTIKLEIKHKNNYSLDLYNSLGQKVKNLFVKNFDPGSYELNFEANALSSGIYYYILSSPMERFVKSFVLLK